MKKEKRTHQDGVPEAVLVLEAAAPGDPLAEEQPRERRVAEVERVAVDVPEGPRVPRVLEEDVDAAVAVGRGEEGRHDAEGLRRRVRVHVDEVQAVDARVAQQRVGREPARENVTSARGLHAPRRRAS